MDLAEGQTLSKLQLESTECLLSQVSLQSSQFQANRRKWILEFKISQMYDSFKQGKKATTISVT